MHAHKHTHKKKFSFVTKFNSSVYELTVVLTCLQEIFLQKGILNIYFLGLYSYCSMIAKISGPQMK